MVVPIATVSASGAAVAALWFSGQSLKVTNDQQALSQQTAVTDRFRLAAEQLASDQINVRLSGIYLLERLAKDSPGDHPTVFTLLTSFFRTHAEASACGAGIAPRASLDSVPVDVQAVLDVITRRDTSHDAATTGPDLSGLCLPHALFTATAEGTPASLRAADFTGTYLRGADFTTANLADAVPDYADLSNGTLVDANLTGANLSRSVLSTTSFSGANLTGAYLAGAGLDHASLGWANLTDANLRDSDLRNTNWLYANLTRAYLAHADLTGAYLAGANLTGAYLAGANLTGANLMGADLTGALFIDEVAGVGAANLTSMVYDDTTMWPAGFTPP
jgi:uncharacterized protein YjbI with pentapeptide repeats